MKSVSFNPGFRLEANDFTAGCWHFPISTSIAKQRNKRRQRIRMTPKTNPQDYKRCFFFLALFQDEPPRLQAMIFFFLALFLVRQPANTTIQEPTDRRHTGCSCCDVLSFHFIHFGNRRRTQCSAYVWHYGRFYGQRMCALDEWAVFRITLIQQANWRTSRIPPFGFYTTSCQSLSYFSRREEQAAKTSRTSLDWLSAGFTGDCWSPVSLIPSFFPPYSLLKDDGYTLWHAPKKTNNIDWLDGVSRL